MAQSAIDYAINGSGPPQYNTNSTTQTTMPQWYEDYVQGLGSKAVDLANRPYQPYPDQRVAGFNPDQSQAFQQIRNNQGAWQPANQEAQGIAGGIVPQVNGRLGQAGQNGQAATAAVAGNAQDWNSNYQKYMSPYTSQVVNEISRLGDQNLKENLIPSVQDNFIGAGQFGSTRNADILGRTVRDAQTNISGLQSQALQSGYNSGAGIFAGDANREQQQQQLQAGTNIQAGNLATQGASVGAAASGQAAGQLGALGQMQQTGLSNDASQLSAAGTMQQGLQQKNLDTSYQDFNNQKNYDWQNLANAKGAIQGLPLPTGSAMSLNSPAANAPASPLSYLNAFYGQPGAAGGTTAGASGGLGTVGGFINGASNVYNGIKGLFG